MLGVRYEHVGAEFDDSLARHKDQTRSTEKSSAINLEHEVAVMLDVKSERKGRGRLEEDKRSNLAKNTTSLETARKKLRSQGLKGV